MVVRIIAVRSVFCRYTGPADEVFFFTGAAAYTRAALETRKFAVFFLIAGDYSAYTAAISTRTLPVYVLCDMGRDRVRRVQITHVGEVSWRGPKLAYRRKPGNFVFFENQRAPAFPTDVQKAPATPQSSLLRMP